MSCSNINNNVIKEILSLTEAEKDELIIFLGCLQKLDILETPLQESFFQVATLESDCK